MRGPCKKYPVHAPSLSRLLENAVNPPHCAVRNLAIAKYPLSPSLSPQSIALPDRARPPLSRASLRRTAQKSPAAPCPPHPHPLHTFPPPRSTAAAADTAPSPFPSQPSPRTRPTAQAASQPAPLLHHQAARARRRRERTSERGCRAARLLLSSAVRSAGASSSPDCRAP